ncbi:MAG: RidA family protein [Ignavibacteria bacterium]|nr:RidA family protein [Ignavibacteria bacterium]
MKKSVFSPDAPKPIGPYSQAIEYGGMIFTSGQVSLNADGAIAPDDVAGQTRNVLNNLKSILESRGSSLDKVIKTTVFLKDMNDFAKMNEVYAQFFTELPPARSTVEVARLPKDAKVEIEVTAYV